MNITVKMPTGEFCKDSSGNIVVDENNQQVPILADKEFTAPFISARKLKRTVVVGKMIQMDSLDENSFDVMADYIADIFGRQFSKDETLDGLSSLDLITEFTRCVEEVTSGLDNKIKEMVKTSPNQ